MTDQCGFSLIVVLAALTIISLLMLALFSNATHGLRLAQGDAYLTRETMLADTAASLVIGQLRQATGNPGQAWVSQPGLIRTFAATSAARAPLACYKLYSVPTLPQMIDTSGSVAFLAADVPANWNSPANQPYYTDLNAPVTPLSPAQPLAGGVVYPILDASAAGLSSSPAVTGLSVDQGHAVEMPVAWLYELQDGTLGPANGATAANPIVGRIAFWTDDETSKIDLNTAGENSAWNTPRTSSSIDLGWAAMQPAAGEYERYPGHPAGVSLSVLFGAGTTANLSGDQLLALTPRYNAGGSDFGTQPTTAAGSVAPKLDRLLGSVDELAFGPALDADGQRVPSAIAPEEINRNRFVLTVHSESPEITLLGEPRVAIWPVSDAYNDSTRTTATDRAVANDATIGTPGAPGATPYYFERHNAANGTDDLDKNIVPGNVTLNTNLIAAGSEQLPGQAATFAQKYPGAQWPQIVLEILDAIRGFNAVDPAAGPMTKPSSFVPFAQIDNTGLGRGLVVPLTSTFQSTTLRGLGRFPTLSGLTLVLYVSGFNCVDSHGVSTTIDYETPPDDAKGSSWQANFQPVTASRWSQVNQVLVRAFVVPTTFQPNCGFPEVNEACKISIVGLDSLTATSGGATGNFGFPHICTSALFSDAEKLASPVRAWGGFEGPLAWSAAAANAPAPYPFAGGAAVAIPLAHGARPDSKTGGPSMPLSWAQPFSTSPLSGLTVQILDHLGNVVQTCSVNLPAISTGHAPTVNGEADQAEARASVQPSYYMTLANRLQNVAAYRPLLIQAGDISYSVEARTDLRLCAALANVPPNFYGPATTTSTVTTQGGTHQNNLRFADGTGACFGTTQATALASYNYAATSATFPVTDWRDGSTVSYPYATSPVVSAPTGSTSVTMEPVAGGVVNPPPGDWDTGPGFEPDGALGNLPDAGTTLDPATAYESLGPGQVGAATRRSPNALVPSPVVFGSLPAGIDPTNPMKSPPWRTLLFNPYPISDQQHPGLASPPDYLLLDKFWTPCVEPYGISGRFVTAGKINLNDQIAPFTYLHRNTALHALLHNLQIPAISPTVVSLSNGTSYKMLPTPQGLTVWQPVDEDATIAQIESRFANGDIYMTEGEICSVPLLPQNMNGVTPEVFWTSRVGKGYLTGDNLRELPYAEIYSRLTTRSNSYTVHVRAQVLQKLHDGTPANVWREGVDRVVGDWRGSYEIERDLDPAAAAPAPGAPLGGYKYRIVSARRFGP